MANLLKSIVWGFGRQIGHTASKRTTEYIGSQIINPRSKFRKRIEKFDLGGDFNSGRKKLITLIEMFHEEYIINSDKLPALQKGTYLYSDIKIIDNKLLFCQELISNDNDNANYETLSNFWKNIKTQLV